ncbi:7TM diverse intracellular signaling domain-containing protein [Ramlibacter sp. PS4R-6]|uniref:7TM diverse intracellular signaling domain-containing protein n=1 Tax=Ramlibacter sp. PS4R-6 TaxID=3133438 RepID=UPI0030973BD9
MRRLAAFVVSLAWAAGVLAQGAPGVVAVNGGDSYVLSKSFVELEDKEGKLGIDDITKPGVQQMFKAVPRDGPGANFGLTSSAIWLKVTLRLPPKAREDWLLEVAYPPLDKLELYAPGAYGWDKQVGGDAYPFGDRVIPHRNHVLPVHLKAGQDNVLYLRVQSEGTVAAPATLWQPSALWQHDLATYSALSLYFGLLIGLFLYNLLLFMSVREAAYAAYCAFAFSLGIGLASLTGLGAQFLWPAWTWWNTVSPPVGLASAAVFGILFARSFLASAQRMPKIDRFLLVQLAGWFLSIVAAVTLPYIVSTYMVTVLAVVSVLTMVVIGIVTVKREFAGAKYFFTAWVMLLVGVVTLALHNTGFLPSNAITSNALLLGSAAEMVLLSFALGDRINVARRFKEAAQARIAAEHAMVEALSQSQNHLRMVLEEREIILQNSIVGIAFLTPDGRLRWANKPVMDLFGIHARPGLSMEPFYMSREQYLQVGGGVAAAVAKGQVFESEVQMRRADGVPIWVSLSGKAVNKDDLSKGTVWVLMDITERKELQAQLQKTGQEREAILNNALVGIVLSVNRRHEWVNEKFAQMLGYPRQVLIGQDSSYIHPDMEAWERFGEEARAALIATGSYTSERQVKRRNGELFWVEMGGSCIRPNDPDSGVIWTFLDITGRKKSEIEIREALEQQKALNELRSRFVAMTSHEFRTPLAAIMSAEELLRHYGDRLPRAERDEILDSISSGVQRMSRMMDRVLLLGKADAGMLDFQPQRIQLAPLVKQFVDEARAQQPHDGNDVKVEIAEDVDEGAYDEKLLRHIFSNLLSNALKYSPHGGEVRFQVRRENSHTVFEVADQGIGIPADEIGHLFESFHRASNVGAIQGTGLGLAIVKNAVEMHGGVIDVESELGKGTTFRVSLPS